MYDFHIPNTIKIDDIYFEELINSLYGYTPYKFDVIEPEFIAEMYDYFLGKELTVENGFVSIVNKKLLPNGSVPTHPELADYVVDNILNNKVLKNEDDVLKVKILDPCAGSGTTLISAINNGRAGIGIEYNSDFSDLIKCRIGEDTNLNLFEKENLHLVLIMDNLLNRL